MDPSLGDRLGDRSRECTASGFMRYWAIRRRCGGVGGGLLAAAAGERVSLSPTLAGTGFAPGVALLLSASRVSVRTASGWPSPLLRGLGYAGSAFAILRLKGFSLKWNLEHNLFMAAPAAI